MGQGFNLRGHNSAYSHSKMSVKLYSRATREMLVLHPPRLDQLERRVVQLDRPRSFLAIDFNF
jgi:hypothetical protein